MKKQKRRTSISPKRHPKTNLDELLTFEELAIFLKVDHTKLRKLIHNEGLPYTSLTRICYDDSDVRFLKSLVIQWLKVKIATQKSSLPYSKPIQKGVVYRLVLTATSQTFTVI